MSKKVKWLVGFIIILVIANSVLLTSIWLRKKENRSTLRPQHQTIDYFVKTLSLNTAQVNSFDSLRKDHFKRINAYQNEMRQLKDSFFNQLGKSQNGQAAALANKMGVLYASIDLETFDHFSQLRAMLNSEQLKKFDNIIQGVLRTMGPKGRPPGRGGPPPMEGGPGPGEPNMHEQHPPE